MKGEGGLSVLQVISLDEAQPVTVEHLADIEEGCTIFGTAEQKPFVQKLPQATLVSTIIERANLPVGPVKPQLNLI
jgi:hypothetical protein